MLYFEQTKKLRAALVHISFARFHVSHWTLRISSTGYSINAWCARHGIDKGNLSRWINGEVVPSRENIDRVHKCLKKDKV